MKELYLAGLIDATGSICLTLYNDGFYRKPIVSIETHTKELIAWAYDNFGGAVYQKKKVKGEYYVWRVTGQDSIELLRKIRPYLQDPNKKARLAIIVDKYRVVVKGASLEEMEYGAQIEKEFYELLSDSREYKPSAVMKIVDSETAAKME